MDLAGKLKRRIIGMEKALARIAEAWKVLIIHRTDEQPAGSCLDAAAKAIAEWFYPHPEIGTAWHG